MIHRKFFGKEKYRRYSKARNDKKTRELKAIPENAYKIKFMYKFPIIYFKNKVNYIQSDH